MIFTCKVYVDLIYQSHFNQPIRYAVCILLYSVYDSRSTVYCTGISSSMYMYMYDIYLKLIFPHVSTDLILKVYTYITYMQMYVCMTYGDIWFMLSTKNVK